MTEAKSKDPAVASGEVPVGNPAGLLKNLRFDLISGLLVFVIALPLCLGIANASNFPAINGIFTAIAGGIICSLLSNSELTIKGPAAGMIAIVMGATLDFAGLASIAKDNLSNTDPNIYLQYLPMVGAVAVVAGVLQLIMGLLKAGSLADFFPTSVIHGLLASIGLIIIGKQLYPLLGLKPNGSTEAYEAYLELPAHISFFAWQVGLIGVASLVFLFVYPFLKKRIALCNVIPAQLIILLVAVPASMYLYRDFKDGKRSYEIQHAGHPAKQEVKSLLVKVPESPSALRASLIYPNFTRAGTFVFWKWVLMFMLVGSLESLLSAKAVETLDPWKRKSDLNRDLAAVGFANAAVASIGGLPMISEIVRSSANKDYGARTRWSNFFHGLFLLLSILALPFVLNKIPLAALAAMLVYAGCRLANYKEFLHMWHVGKEQLAIFLATIAGVLATDLLIGVGIGIATKIVIHMINGMSIATIFSPAAEVIDQVDEDDVTVRVTKSLVFSNWIAMRRKLEKLGIREQNNVTLDLSGASLVDHTVMDKLHELEQDFQRAGLILKVVGLENLRSLSGHQHAARKK